MSIAFDADYDPRTALQRAAAIKRKFRAPQNAKTDHGINIVNGKPLVIEEPAPSPEQEPTRKETPVYMSDDEYAREFFTNLHGPVGHPPIKAILLVVSQHYGVRMQELLSVRRKAKIVWARQVAMHIARTSTPFSFPQIGHHLGGRDHTTVIHATRKIAERIETDEHLRYEIQFLTTRIYERCGIEQPRDGE